MNSSENAPSADDIQQLRNQLTSLEQRVLSAIAVDYRQTEALLMLTKCLPLRYPLPPMRGWAVAPDLALSLYQCVRDQQADWIIECGSGVSSIVMGYALEVVGKGRLIALEHDERFADATSDLINRHELSDYIEVVHAPLEPIEVDGTSWQWYGKQLQPALVGKKASLLVIDGPPGNIQPQARYPALPLLEEYLTPDVFVVLDDAGRPDEKAIVERWLQKYNGLMCQYLPHEKGTAILWR